MVHVPLKRVLSASLCWEGVPQCRGQRAAEVQRAGEVSQRSSDHIAAEPPRGGRRLVCLVCGTLQGRGSVAPPRV